jgi:alpha-D-xyloside xylohydrolase
MAACKNRPSPDAAGVKDDEAPPEDEATDEAAANAPHKIVDGGGGVRLRITPYGPKMVRVQAALAGKDFVPDDYNETIQQETAGGSLTVVRDDAQSMVLKSGQITLTIAKPSLAVTYADERGATLLQHRGVTRSGSQVGLELAPDASEHFIGLGHDYYGTIGKNRGIDHRLDLKGQVLERNYAGRECPEDCGQSPLVVPFYASSKGYGVFVNSFFKNRFSFGANNSYRIDLDSLGRDDEKVEMDYVFILGPTIPEIVDQYTQLTGRPRLPPLSILGLQLSDKSHAADSLDKGANFWREKVTAHRAAAFPLDHLVNDNRWRQVPAEQKATTIRDGGRCSTVFAWNPENYGGCRHPGPGVFCSLADWRTFLDRERLTITIDFNRCTARLHDNWKPAFNIPNVPAGIPFGASAPDFTNPDVRQWFWHTMFDNTLSPKSPGQGLGDALWIDEFDQLTNIPPETVLKNGRSWFESRNSWFYLIAKALVQEGWLKSMPKSAGGAHGNRRPYVWTRGQSAGGQRFASLWSGDIGSPLFFNDSAANAERDVAQKFLEMRNQIRGMQAAGISGFAFWGHDAGGFRTLERSVPGKETLYRVWGMEMGAFAPIFKPHGSGKDDSSRWPLDRGAAAQKTARRYTNLRYALMPYTYGLAHEAARTGAPMARAMPFHFQSQPRAWAVDLQYLWGKDLLVAPITRDPQGQNPVQTALWLPPGKWFRFWDEAPLDGGGDGRDITNSDELDNLPLFARAGAIIPMAEPQDPAKGFVGTGFMNLDQIDVHVYKGGDGHFTMVRDDGKTEAYLDGDLTKVDFDLQSAAGFTFKISSDRPSDTRSYRVFVHGAGANPCVAVNGQNANARPASFNNADGLRDNHTLPAVGGVHEGDTVTLCN